MSARRPDLLLAAAGPGSPTTRTPRRPPSSAQRIDGRRGRRRWRAADEIADAFAGTLQFGTAGLRGKLGPGPNRMNRVVVSRAAAGLAQYLLDQGQGGTPVVIGFDARHNSDVFARDTAEIFAGAGFRAMVCPRPLPTPVLAGAILTYGASAGVVVTASHNPPQDNGYKVYLGDGSQIVPPADAGIAACIEAVGALADIPRSDEYAILDEGVVDSYLARVCGLALPGGAARHLGGLHGHARGRQPADEGGADRRRVPRAAGGRGPGRAGPGLPDRVVPEPGGARGDGPGHGPRRRGARRPGPGQRPGRRSLRRRDPAGRRRVPDAHRRRGGRPARLVDPAARACAPGTPVTGTYANSIVSSQLLGAIARDAGLGFRETLTGFKWISRAADDLAFGYEEALGYCVDPTGVRDKDGISAGLLVTEMAAALKAEGRGVQDVLDDLATAHGVHATSQVSLRFTDLSAIPALMASLRAAAARPGSAGWTSSRRSTSRPGSPDLPPTDGLKYMLGGAQGVDGARVIIRPSGTEPKIKAYLEVRAPVGADGVAAARSVAGERLAAVAEDVRARLTS